ncbi:MAG: twin-arginine translocation signal domain-containing protein, partial [Burkholderiales bacterium]
MCIFCQRGLPHRLWNSRRGFLKAAAAGTAVASGAASLFAPRIASAHGGDDNEAREPEYSGQHGRRYLIRGGAVMSMDPAVGDFV